MKSYRVFGAVLAGCLLLGGGVASASVDEQGPGSRPKSEGPVYFDESTCSNNVVRSGSGEVLGKAESCVYLYSFDTLSEIDLAREYGGVWLQARFIPATGWCATEVGSRLALTGGAPEGISKETSEGRKTETKLTLTANGNALENGRISQAWTQGAGSTETTATTGRPNVTSEWKGKTSKPVNLVSGVGYSYEFLQGAPGKVNFGFTNFSLVTC